MERHKVLQHRARLVERTITIVLAHSVLLQEVIFEHSGDLQRDLVSLAQRALSDQLHNFGQIIFLLQDLLGLVAVGYEPRVSRLVVGFKDLDVFRVRYVPVDGREVLPLRELLVQSPEDLDNTKSSSCDGVREITTRGRDAIEKMYKPLVFWIVIKK